MRTFSNWFRAVAVAVAVGVAAPAAADEGDAAEVLDARPAEVLDARPQTNAANAAQRRYRLYWQLDAPLVVIGSVLVFGRRLRAEGVSPPPYCTTLDDGCDPDTINAIDRPFAGAYSSRWRLASNVATAGVLATPLVLALGSDWQRAATEAALVYEVAFLGSVLAGLSTQITGRERPFVYGADTPEDERLGGEGSLSFFSGHAAAIFGASTSLFWILRTREPHGSKQWWALGGGTAAATFVGVARVASGDHFPTDVIGGALVGVALGTLLPALHEVSVTVAPLAEESTRGIAVSGSF